MRTDLKVPCKNCPFANRPGRITFAGMERATEIAETAYRNGFPCHLSAEYHETPDGEGGFYPSDTGQHCAGALAMFLNDDNDCWPGIDNDEDLADRLRVQLAGAMAIAFDSEEAFIEANRDPRFDGEAA